MTNISKRLLSMLLVVFMVISMLPTTVFAAEVEMVSTLEELKTALSVEGASIQLSDNITVDSSITVPDGTTINLNNKTLYINVEDSCYGDVTIQNGNIVIGKDDVHVCNGYFLVNADKTLVLNNVKVSSADGGIKGYAVFHLKTGANLDLIDSTVDIGANEYAAGYLVYAGEATATVDITGSAVKVDGNGIVHATTVIDDSSITIDAVEHGINRSGVTINDSNVTISGGTGRGITAQHGDLVVTGNSVVNISEMGEATIELRGDKNLSIESTAKVTVDKAVNNTTSGTVTGAVKVNTALGKAIKVGDQGYDTLADALAAAKTMTGDVTVEIYDKVTLNSALFGSFDSIKFVGKDADAEIYLDVQGYTTATGKKVAFEDLTLSKAEGGYVANAGFMNVAFGIYDVAEVTYTNCTFANGACAGSGKVTYTGCTFKRSWDKYGLWAYGDVDVTVDGCTFADYRGIKMYAEGMAKTVDLTVKNTNFSAVNNKPAIVLTCGERVTLEGNTYSSTGVFELDLDGAPNGTTVTSADAITCVNDNGACGVLVDGKIYTSVAQAAEVATSGSTVTLLHNSTETVELAKGVILDKNGFDAAGITVESSVVYVAKIVRGAVYDNEMGFDSVVNAGTNPKDTLYFETLRAAFEAAQDGETIELLRDVTLITSTSNTAFEIAGGRKLTLDLHGFEINADFVSGSTTNHQYAFANNADLTIVGKGEINARGIFNYGSLTLAQATINAIDGNGGYGVRNYSGASFTMNGGVIAATNEDGDAPGAGFDATPVRVDAGATAVINGGKLNNLSNYTTALENYGTTTINYVEAYAIHTTIANNGVLTIKDGKFVNDGLENITAHVIWAAGGTTTVNGGTFDGKDNYNGFNIDASAGATVNVTGGKFLSVHSGSLYGEGKIAVSGGIFFDKVAEKYCAEGFVPADNGDGTYGVVEHTHNYEAVVTEPTFDAQGYTTYTCSCGDSYVSDYVDAKVAVAEVNGEYFATFAEAVKKIATDGTDTTIKLLNDIELTESIDFQYGTGKIIFTADKPVTVKQTKLGLDLGFTIGNDTPIVIDENVTFEIYDNASGMYIYYGPSLNVKGAIVGGQNWGCLYLFYGDHVVAETGKIGVGRVQSGFNTVTVYGEVDTNYLLIEGGKFIADGAVIDAVNVHDSNNGGMRWGASTFTIKNGSTVNAGTVTLGYAESVLSIDATSKLTAKTIKGAGKIIIDATGMTAGEVATITGDVSGFTGTLEVINNPALYAVVENGKIVLKSYAAKIGNVYYETINEALAAVQEGETIELLAGVTISEGTVKMPAELKDVTIKGAEGAALKDTTLMAADGNSLSYVGLTIDGVVFDNSRISITGWRNNGVIVEDLTVTNCEFKNLNDTTNSACVHINMAATEPVNGFTFSNNVIDGATGGSKSGVYAQVTGEVNFTGNVINNVAFRPFVIQITTDDGVADEFIVTGNTFSGSAAGRTQGLGNNAAGTDTVKLVVSENIFKGITNAQQICYWNFNEETTTADLSKNYYDIDILATPDRIYFNSPAQDAEDLIEMGVFPYYADEAKTQLVEAPAIMVTYADGTVEYFDDMRAAVPHSTNVPKLEGATITLLQDMSGLGMRLMENGMVFDLNGHTYTLTGGTGSKGTETSGFQIRPEVTETATIKNGTIKIAEGVQIIWMFNNYATNFVVEDVTVDCANMAYSYGESCYVYVSRADDNAQFIGTTNIINFNAAVAGNAINVADTMTIGENVVPGGSIELEAGATLTGPEGLDVVTVDGYRVAYANGVYTSVCKTATVMNKAELDAALASAIDGDTIILGADIDYGTTQLAITKAITLDLGGKTLTTRNAYGGMSVKGNPTIKNGTIVHASNTAAIKVWNAAAFEDLVIDVQGKGDANKTIGGIVLQSGSTTCVGSIKNVTIKGDALTNGIETYNCGDAAANVIGSMENVTINAKGTGMLISAPCGTATNCSITGGTTGIEIWIKGNYSATLDLVDCEVNGGKQAVFAHDEFSSNPSIVNNGTLKLTANETTTFESANNAPLTLTIARAENVVTTTFDAIIETCEAKIGDTYYASLQDAVNAAQTGETITVLDNIVLTESLVIAADDKIILNLNGKTISQEKACTESYEMINNKGNLTITGDGKISFTDTSAGDPSFGWGSYTLRNEGTLVVENGTIAHLGQQNQGSVKHMYCAIFQYSGSTTINGGTISTPTYRSVRLWMGDMTINGGNFEGQVWVQAVDNSAKLTITDGSFAPRGVDGSSVFVGNITSTGVLKDVELNVIDGNFATKIGANNAEAVKGDKILGGTFTETAKNGTNEALLGACYVFVENADGTYGVEEKVELPEVVITDIKDSLTASDPKLTFALNFAIKDLDKLTDAYLEKLFATYGDHYVDYVLTIEGLTDSNVTFNADGSGDGYLAGRYAAWANNAWISVPYNKSVTINNGDSLYIMETAAGLMGKQGLRFTLQEVAEIVQNFDCGIYFTDEFLRANPNMKVTLELKVFEEDAQGNKIEDLHVATKVFEAPAVLPEVVITDIKDSLTDTDPDLTFALNFAIKDLDKLTDAYLQKLFAAYGDRYVDYVLTIKGLTDANVTFNANGTADGYLAGQYDAWSENWVNVPFEDVTINNGDSLYIMEYAAKLMGKQGLRFTLEEVAEIVKNFDCGIYFTPEFLAANPDLEVTLELKVFEEDAQGNKINDISVAEETFTIPEMGYVAQNVQTGKLYTTVAQAMAEVVTGETVMLLTDVEENITVLLYNKVKLDLNGYKLKVNYVIAAFDESYIIDSTDGEGLLIVAQKNLSILGTNEQLPVWYEGEGFRFTTIKFVTYIEKGDEYRGAGSARFYFWFEGEDGCFLDQILTNDVLDKNIYLSIKVTYTISSKDTMTSQYFVFTEQDVKDYAADFDWNAFVIGFQGLDAVEDVEFQAAISYGEPNSDGIVLESEIVEYN